MILPRIILAAFALVGCCALPLAGQDAVYRASRIALYSSVALDLTSTEIALRRGYREGNPILGQNTYRRVGIATGATVAGDLASRWLKRRGHGKLATFVNFATAGLHFWATAHNLRRH